LKTPWQSEGGLTVEEGTAVANEEHDENAPRDGPLLKSDKTATLGGRSQFGDVHGDLSGAYPHRKSVAGERTEQLLNLKESASGPVLAAKQSDNGKGF